MRKDQRFEELLEKESDRGIVVKPDTHGNKKQKRLMDMFGDQEVERKKNYNFTLYPSTRKKLAKLGKELPVKSDSVLMERLIDELYEEVYGEEAN